MEMLKGTTHWKRTLAGVFLSLSSALLFALAFPPFELWPLVFFGLVPMILAQHRILPGALSGTAYGIGVGGFFGLYFWDMFRGGPWMMKALPIMIAVIAGLAAGRDRQFHRQTGYRWFLLQGPTVWVGIEQIRNLIPSVGTWGFAGYALYNQPWFIQPVSIFGIFGLSFMILVINYGLALVLIMWIDRRLMAAGSERSLDHFRGRNQLAAGGTALAVWIGISLIMFGRGMPDGGRTVHAAALQPGFKAVSDEGVFRLIALTEEAALQGAELVVWPEGALPFDPQEKFTGELRRLTEERELHLVIGYGVQAGSGSRNEAVILTPEGDFLGPYGKTHPVVWSGETSLTRGPVKSYATDLGALGMMICYDLDFTDTARETARAGARLIAVPSFDWGAIAEKHYTHLVFRAVENRTAVIKADIAFDSALIDPLGRILAREFSPEAEKKTLLVEIPLGPEEAWVRHLGDWFGWLCLVGMIPGLGSYPFRT